MSVTYKNPGPVKFIGKILRADGGGAFVEFPPDVENLYGYKGRVPVKVIFDGIPYRGSMVKMGGDRHILLILKEIREKLNKDRGDKIRVTVELDVAPRIVRLAQDIEIAYKKAGDFKACRSLSFTHQREHTFSIEAAKQAETRVRRIAKSIEMLRAMKAL